MNIYIRGSRAFFILLINVTILFKGQKLKIDEILLHDPGKRDQCQVKVTPYVIIRLRYTNRRKIEPLYGAFREVLLKTVCQGAFKKLDYRISR